MRRIVVVVVAAAALSACASLAAFQVKAQYPKGNAVSRAPAPRAELLTAQPTDREPFAVLDLQGNGFAKPSECEARALEEGRELGGSAVFVRPTDPAMPGAGPACEARVYEAAAAP